ncbi:hypothetical protein [Burkholderia sp. Ax-1719]|uniref:hypothetical protein n=1 Tax=Burkholderia sp. Ax-1719 TaxID=2608334 RepID=UPI0014203B76|nr:hypothetical protein [Burkholderia sp. Ax-1719]NIE66711.1 hypothetical protein [Burkholderia sp. Ax-1719]
MFALTDRDTSLCLPLSGRDPLGTQAVWQRRARDIVPNLTAASGLSEGFHILLVVLAWWPVMATRKDSVRPKLQEFFLLIEQAFARACRCADKDWRLPGSRRLNDGDTGVWISLEKSAHLLDNQLTNGVWGLYRGPAHNAGLIDEQNRICSAELAARIRERTPIVRSLLQPIAELLTAGIKAPPCKLASNRSNRIVTGLTEILDTLPFRREIRETFVVPVSSPITVDLAKLLGAKDSLSNGLRMFMAGAIESLPQHAPTLENVIGCEQFIAPLDAIFEEICSTEERDVDRVVKRLKIDLAVLRAARERFARAGTFDGLSRERADALLRLDLSSARALVRSLIDHHAAISESRNSSPWIVLDDSGRLDCSLAANRSDVDGLSPVTAWRNGYYLQTLHNLAHQVGTRVAR